MEFFRREAQKKNPMVRFDPIECRKQRIEDAFQLRSRKREDEVMLQRNVSEHPEDEVDTITSVVMDIDMNNNEASEVNDEWIRLLYHDESYEQLRASFKIRSVIDKDQYAAAQSIISSGHIRRILELLDNPNANQMIQLNLIQVLVAVTYSANSTQLQELIWMETNGISVLCRLLEMEISDDSKAKVMLVLGNIAGDSVKLRDWVLTKDVLSVVIKVLDDASHLKLLRYGSWALTNLCNNVNFKEANQVLPLIKKLIADDDYEIIEHACLVLANLGDGYDQLILQFDFCIRLVELLSEGEKIVTAALIIIRNISFGSEQQCQQLIDYQVLPALHRLIGSSKPKEIIHEACAIISNIAFDSTSHIQALIDANIYLAILPLLEASDENLRLDAVWAIRQATSRSRTSKSQVKSFIEMGCIEALIMLLSATSTSRTSTIRYALKVLRNMLDIDDCVSKVLKQCDGI